MKRKMGLAVLAVILVCVLTVSVIPNRQAFAQTTISHEPVLSAEYGSDITISAEITDASEATLYYNTFGKGAAFNAVPMTAEGSTFSATLSGIALVPEIYYYIKAGDVSDGSEEAPHKIKVSAKQDYVKPQVVITEMNAVNGRRYDFVEMRNTGDAPLKLSEVSLVMNEYICDGTKFTVDESNNKGEAFFAIDAGEGVKQRITAENEVEIAPGEYFVMFIGKTAIDTTEQKGLAKAPFNFEYLKAQYTEGRVGSFGVNSQDIVDYGNTKMFLAVSDPYSADSAVIPDPSAAYKDTAYGTMWTVKVNGEEVTRAVVGMNNDGSAALEDKSTNSNFSETAGVSSVHYSPYFVDVEMGGVKITVQSRTTASKQTAISFGYEKAVPSLNALTEAVDLNTPDEVKQVAVAEIVSVDGGNYFADEYQMSYALSKDGEGSVPASDGNVTINGLGHYVLTATVSSEYFDTFETSVEFDALADSVPPTLSDPAVTPDVAFGGTIDFSVTITDNVALSETQLPKLFYKTAVNAEYKSVLLNKGENDVYSASISSVKAPYVYYYIQAEDALGNVGSIGNADEPEKYTIGAPADSSDARLIITEANSITSKRADFIEIYNNSNKPVALSKVVIKRYDYIVTNGAYTDAFLNREANAETGLAVSKNGNTDQEAITENNEVYIAPGETFVVFTGDIYALSKEPYYFDYVRDYYAEENFPGIDLSALTDNVNAFLVMSVVDGSPKYSASKYGTAYAVEYDGVENCVAVVGMDNDGNFVDEASSGSNSGGVGSSQFGKWSVDIEKNGVTQTFRGKISENKEAVISFNKLVEGQTPDAQYIVKPEVSLTQSAVTVYGVNGTYDLTSLLDINLNGYTEEEFTITANDGAEIADLVAYAYSAGTKTVVFTVSSATDEFEAYTLSLEFTVVDSPTITVAEDLSVEFTGAPVKVSDFYTVNPGAFANAYKLTVTCSTLPVMDGLMLVAGSYDITVTVDPVNAGDFDPVSAQFTVRLLSQPVITGEDAVTMQSCESIDLNGLFNINKGGHEDAVVEFTATKDGQAVEVNDGKIAGVAGVYTITVKVSPASGDSFETVEKTLTLTVENRVPSVSAKQAEVNVVAGDGKTVDVAGLFNVDLNGYTAEEATVTYAVTKDGQPVTIENGKFAAAEGTYVCTATISAAGGQFEAVSANVTVNVVAAPSVTVKDGADTKVESGKEIDLSAYVNVNVNGLPEGSYTVVYKVTYNGEKVALDGGKFSPSEAGEYKVEVRLASNDGAFETVTYDFTITVEGKTNVGLIVGLSAGGAVVVIAAAVAAVLIIKKKKAA